MKAKAEYQFRKEDYDKLAVSWPDLEASTQGGCQCENPGCDKRFSESNPMEFGVKCHPCTPLWVSYWDGWMYFRCAVCDNPVARVEINKSLL